MLMGMRSGNESQVVLALTAKVDVPAGVSLASSASRAGPATGTAVTRALSVTATGVTKVRSSVWLAATVPARPGSYDDATGCANE